MDDKQPDTPWEFKPGDSPAPIPDAGATQVPVQSDIVQNNPTPEAAPPQPPQSVEDSLPTAKRGPITWTASEFIAHSKSVNWYLTLGIAAIVGTAIVYVLTKDKISSGVVLVAAAALGAYGGRQPRQLEYGLNETGLSIGQKQYPYEAFRSFAVMDEGAFSSISFLPLKRFGQLITIYYDPNDEQSIVDLLSQRLPMEPRQHDMVDRFMKRIRF